MTLLHAQPCLVLTDRDGSLGWLGQFPDAATARAAMEHWLAEPDRDDEDAAFILPVIGFGRPDLLARTAAADKGEAE
jgi:hypothetical protein